MTMIRSVGTVGALLGAALLLAATLAGCARAGSQNQRQYVRDREIREPEVMLIHEFELDARSPSQSRVYADRLANMIVRELNQRKINARRAYDDTVAPPDSMVVRGRLVSVDPGSGAKRTLVGFGAGAEEIELRLTVSRQTPEGEEPLVDVSGEAEGAKTPGLTTSAAGAAATGNPAGFAVGSVMAVRRERNVPIDQSLERLAEELADRALGFYQRRGWR